MHVNLFIVFVCHEIINCKIRNRSSDVIDRDDSKAPRPNSIELPRQAENIAQQVSFKDKNKKGTSHKQSTYHGSLAGNLFW